MGIFTQDKAKNWIEGLVCIATRSITGKRIHSVLRDNKIAILIFLIIISGFFFYNGFGALFPRFFVSNYDLGEYILLNDKDWISSGVVEVKEVAANKKIEKEKGYLIKSKIVLENKEDAVEDSTENQLHQLVGNAPIKEMIPFIAKLDRKVAAFVVGIAKKESDWGRHAPSQGGKTCYNYWGYKGSGSRGTSMGYACFGNPEEAVEIVGKRIETLVAKNINEPRKMLVWKCGSSCSGHDPAGVQKWVSDVSLYFGKVMQI